MIYPYTFDQLTAPFADVVDALFNSEIILSQRGEKYNSSEWCSGRALAFNNNPQKTNSGGTRTPSFKHQGERKAFQAYYISPFIKLIRVDSSWV